ncbi:hypothetical protein [Catellatospora sp. NPDC049609]|uniref:hypothetical protein n=1 Tax=Catellatospora sp. NPDC049609 TaxID=3155505 RepID=UPI00343E440C
MYDDTAEAFRGHLLDLAEQLALRDSPAGAADVAQALAAFVVTEQIARVSLLTCAEMIKNLVAFDQAGPLVLPSEDKLTQFGPDVARELRDAATGVNALVHAVTVGQVAMIEGALAFLGCGYTTQPVGDGQEHLVTALGLMLKFIGRNLHVHDI